MSNKSIESCKKSILPIKDVLEIISGKWTLNVFLLIMFQKRRFSELENLVEGISPKMLAKELRNLESNKLIERNISVKSPFLVEYKVSQYGKSFKRIILELETWGINHRKLIMKK